MKTLGRICLALMLVGLATMPAMADGATTTTEVTKADEVWDEGVFVCFTDIPWEEYEWFTGTWWGNEVYHVIITPSGHYNMFVNYTAHGSGVGETTGDEFSSSTTWHDHYTGRVGEAVHWVWPAVLKNVTKNRLQIHDMHYHVTVNANGEVTVFRYERDVRCAGPDK